MKKFAITLFCMFALTFAASALDSDLTQVIRSQIDAFNKDDTQKAFEFAAPTIKNVFGDHQRFGVMVRQGYPMVVRQKAITFQGAQVDGLMAMQDVMIEDMSGDLHLLRYGMILLDGEWKIASVEILRAAIVAT